MKNLRITVNGTSYDVQVEELGGSTPAPVKTATPAPVAQTAPVNTGSQGGVTIEAPMPGVVVKIEVSVGDKVTAGQDLVFVEAMKMETPVKAPQDGTIASINVQKGESVDTGIVLLTMN